MPIVQPGQINLDQFTPQTPGPNLGERLSLGIGHGMQNLMEAMALQTRQEREEREAQSQIQLRASQTSGSDLENVKARNAIKDQQRVLEAKGRAGRMFNEYIGGGAKQESLGTILATEKDPDAINAFLDSVKSHTAQVNDQAVARKNAVDAMVAESTSTEQISKTKSDSARAGTDATISAAAAGQAVTQEGLQSDIMRANLANIQAETQRLQQQAQETKLAGIDEQAMKLYKTGMINARDSWARYGGTPPPGIDPDSKLEGKGLQAFRIQAKAAATNILVANQEMDELIGKGVQMTVKSTLLLKAPGNAGRSQIPGDQQRLLAAGAATMSQYALMMTGKAMTDNESERLSMQIIAQAGDSPETVRSKQVRREMILQITYDASKGNRPGSEIIGDVLRKAKADGMSDEFTNYLKQSQIKAIEMEQKYVKEPDTIQPSSITAGMQPGTPDTTQAFLNQW